ncbi:hypothetical protein OQJ02_05050 [Legionella sp. PATHC032]|uniref:hypothetical protein n=1 Tax=Legionella sp. PATHC032 TaxID=2992039 RepID=UPI001B207ECC|nr:hypothetical protein [Legionella sp. PATHC032]MCW8420997.1 hypothetical protein [Legionella sp. PATHC032]HBA1634298.1 hypothetical protein [Legionella pneumophila]
METKSISLSALFLLSIFITNNAIADDFCEGFEQGYKTGYKEANDSTIDPLVPLCPLEPLKKLSDPVSDYEFGYTIGYKKGLSER